MTAPPQLTEGVHHPAPPPTVVAVCGEPVVGRALVLLLAGPRYDARFVPGSSLGEAGSLEGVELVVLTPMWELGGDGRGALLASLRRAPGAARVPILELTVTPAGGRGNGEVMVEPVQAVPWPCSRRELERRLEAALEVA